MEKRVVKDDFLLFLGEVSKIRCEPKSVTPNPVFLTLTWSGESVMIEKKEGADQRAQERGKFGARTVGRW